MKTKFFIGLLASSLVLTSTPALATPLLNPNIQPFFFGGQKQSLKHTHFKLPNGLTVYLSRNPQKPRFYAEVVVNAGGKNDPSDSTGIAHYLEHMLFKGTNELGTNNFPEEKVLLDKITALYETHFTETDPMKRAKLQKEINQLSVKASQFAIPGEMDSVYARLGATGLNAYTSFEETVYLVDMPKNRLEQWAKVESERFSDAVFRLFQSEIETVYEEKNISLDDKDDLLWENVQSMLYKKHPYGQQTILGSVEHLKNPSLKKMYAFFNTYYVPNNMALIISGDIDIAQTKKVIQKYFGAWKSRPVKAYPKYPEAPLKGREKVHVNYKGEPKVMLAFRTDNYYAKDRLALQMVDMLLDSGKFGLLKLNLVNSQKVRSAGSFPYILKDHGAQFMYAIPRKGQNLKEAEALLLAQLEKIKQGNFDEKLLKGISLDYEIRRKKSLDSNRGRNGILKEAFLKGVSVDAVMREIDDMKKLTKKDIVDVVSRYFGSDYVVGYRHDKEQKFPKVTKPKLEKVKLNPNQRSAFAKSVEGIQSMPIEPRWVNFEKDFKIESYAPGVLYHYVKNPTNNLFDFTISYDYGDKHHPNFCSVMSRLNTSGAGSMSSDEVLKKFFLMGVKANYSCGDYGFLMRLQGLDSQFEKALKLGEEVLWDAKIDAKRFKAKIENQLTNRADQKKSPKTLRQALRSYIRYGKKSAYLERPSAAELRAIDPLSYSTMADALKKQNFKIYYTGQLPKNKVKSLVQKYHTPYPIKKPLLAPRVAPENELLRLHTKPVKIYFLNHNSVQTSIDMILPQKPTNPKENLMAKLYNEYLDGGMGAIMFQEVRESRALAYSTWSWYLRGNRLGDEDQMLAYIGTQGDKTPDALKLLIELMKTPPKSKNHFKRAIKALENKYRTDVIDFKRILGQVQYWADQGLAHDPRPAEFKALEETQLDDIFKFIQTKVASQPLTFALVGNKDKIDMKALRKLGEVEEVAMDTLFRD